MRLVGYFFFACVLLSLVQAALSALVVVALILLIIGLFSHPAETFGFLGVGLLACLFQNHPIAAVWLVSALVLASVMLRNVPRDIVLDSAASVDCRNEDQDGS